MLATTALCEPVHRSPASPCRRRTGRPSSITRWIDLPGLRRPRRAGLARRHPALAQSRVAGRPLVEKRANRGQGPSDPSQAWFVAMIGAVLVVGMAIVLAAHAVQPIVVDRYLFAVPVLVSALLAVPAARLARDRWLFGLLALVAVVGAALADDRKRHQAVVARERPDDRRASSPAARRPRSTPPAAGRWDRPRRPARRGARIRSSSAPTARSRRPGAIPSTSSAKHERQRARDTGRLPGVALVRAHP